MQPQFEKTPEQRKRESNELLASRGIDTLDHLPLLESAANAVLRSKEEVVQRMYALLLISMYAEGLCTGEEREEHREWVQGLVEQFGAHDFFSPEEKWFLDDEDPDDGDCINFSWQYEPLSVMLWALGVLPTKDALGIPAVVCDAGKTVGAIKDCPSYEAALQGLELRSKEEILDQADLIYRYDWACVDARLHGRNDESGEWGVVMERHKALNWLTCYGIDGVQEWDDVSTDT